MNPIVLGGWQRVLIVTAVVWLLGAFDFASAMGDVSTAVRILAFIGVWAAPLGILYCVGLVGRWVQKGFRLDRKLPSDPASKIL